MSGYNRKTALSVAVALVAFLASACSSDSAGLQDRVAQLERRIEQMNAFDGDEDRGEAATLVELESLEDRVAQLEVDGEKQEEPESGVEKCSVETLIELGNVQLLLSLYSIIADGDAVSQHMAADRADGLASEISVVRGNFFELIDRYDFNIGSFPGTPSRGEAARITRQNRVAGGYDKITWRLREAIDLSVAASGEDRLRQITELWKSDINSASAPEDVAEASGSALRAVLGLKDELCGSSR